MIMRAITKFHRSERRNTEITNEFWQQLRRVFSVTQARLVEEFWPAPSPAKALLATTNFDKRYVASIPHSSAVYSCLTSVADHQGKNSFVFDSVSWNLWRFAFAPLGR